MTATAKTTAWTHRVCRMTRGGQGQWLQLGRGRGFASADEAKRAAREWAAELTSGCGIPGGHRVIVIARKGGRNLLDIHLAGNEAREVSWEQSASNPAPAAE